MNLQINVALRDRLARATRVISALDGAMIDSDAILATPDDRVGWGWPTEAIGPREIRIRSIGSVRRVDLPTYDGEYRVDVFCEREIIARQTADAIVRELNKRNRVFPFVDPATGKIFLQQADAVGDETFDETTRRFVAEISVRIIFQLQEE